MTRLALASLLLVACKADATQAGRGTMTARRVFLRRGPAPLEAEHPLHERRAELRDLDTRDPQRDRRDHEREIDAEV